MKKRRFLSIFLALCTLLGMLPSLVFAIEGEGTAADTATAAATEDSGDSGEALLDSLLNTITTSTPEGFDDDSATPYGTKQDEVFTLIEKEEIFSFVSKGGSVSEAWLMDDVAETDFTYNGYGGTKVDGTKSYGMKDDLFALRFAQGVAFDPTGCGRKNFVAIVGYSQDESSTTTGSVYLFIINADTKAVTCKHTLRSGDSRLRSVMDQLTVVDSPNFFSITAGDYNGDGKDTLVVYTGCVTSASSTGLYEVTYTNGSGTTKASCSQTVIGTGTGSGSDSLLNSYYMNNTDSIMSSTELRNQLTVDLTTGDFNNDGVDDLLVLSGMNYPTSCYDACLPQLRIRYKSSARTVVSAYTIGGYEEDGKRYRSIASGSVSVGNINDDGDSEVVVAGFYTEVEKLSKHHVKDHTIGYAILTSSTKEGTVYLQTLKDSDVSGVSQGDSLRENEYAIQQFSVECVALGGIGTAEYVFLNGYLYYYSSGSLKPITYSDELNSNYMISDKYNILHKAATSYIGSDIDEVFVYSSSVGNVFATNDGSEAILLTVAYKTHTNANDDSKDKEGTYYFSRMIIYMGGGTQVRFDYFQSYDPSKGKTVGPAFASGDGASGFSCLLLAVDYGKDSVVAKYSQKAYTYTDPAPVAFLQAAPYFGEFDAGNSSTTYSYSETYSYSTGTSTEYSYDIGFTSEIETSAMKLSFDAGCSYEVSEEFTKTMDTTYTTTFEANDKNQVIIRQSVVYYYLYDVMTGVDSNGDPIWTEDSYVISVPKYPVLTSLTVDQYNALANAYNTKVTELSDAKNPDVDASYKLPTISDAQIKKYYLNNEGNPFNYAPASTSYSNGYDMYLEDGSSVWMRLSRAGGTLSQACTVSLTSEQSTTTSEGMYVNMSVMLGAEAFGVGAYGGISAGYSRMSGHSYSTARTTEKETAGAIQNLAADAPAAYSFMWKLIGWKDSSFLSGVPCIGYAVSKVSAALMPVQDLEATYTIEDDQVLLSWTSPEATTGRGNIDGFEIYQNGEYLTWVENVGAGEPSYYGIDVSEYEDIQLTYTLISTSSSDPSQNSISSNEAVCFLVLSGRDTLDKIDETLSALETAIEQLMAIIIRGDEGVTAELTEALTKALADLTAAYEEADALLKAYVDELAAGLAETLTEEVEEIRTQMAALEEAMNTADQTLQDAIDLVQKNLDRAIRTLKAAIADGDEENAAILTEQVAALTKAYQAADTLLRDENSIQQAELDELRSALTNLTYEVADQVARFESELETLNDVNTAQSKSLDHVRTIATVGLCISVVSLLGNIALLCYALMQRKKVPTA